MANWLLALDDDAGRRGEYARGLRAVVAPIPGLRVDGREGSGWSAVWAAAPAAPVDARGEAPWGALLWGEARDEQGTLQDAAGIRAAWRDGAIVQWDGYYAAAVVEQHGRVVTVGTDLLGMFPVYYWTDGAGVVLVGTSAELFRSHPRFVAQLDETGLAGILLTNGLVDGRTLWRGVRRLGPGRRLRVEGPRVWEEDSYRIPVDRCAVELPLAGHVEQLHEAVGGAVKRHAPTGRRYGLLLSGGLDSRMVVGLLAQAGVSPRALTMGLPSDLEMRCASAVAKRYGLEHVAAEPVADDYPAFAAVQARWEHLANGFNTVRDWWVQGRVGELGDRLVTGGLADSLIGGTSISWAYEAGPPRMSYEAFVAHMPRLGISPEVLRSLLLPARFAGIVEEVQRSLRDEFHGYGANAAACAWRYDLAHGQRYHVGSTIWRLSFGAWPVIPMLDRRVAAVAAAIPASGLADRSAQLELVRTRIPELGDVPLDRSDLLSDEPQYLAPNFGQLLAAAARQRLRGPRALLSRLRPGHETRYWFRINNFDGAAWQRVRAAAEPHREALHSLFDPAALRATLPPPGESPARGPWVGESGRKLLVGLLSWAGDHAPV